MNFETQIIPIAPRLDAHYGGPPAIQLQDMRDAPTVADYAPPYATAPAAMPTDNAGISLSRISKAWAHTTEFYTQV